MKKGHRLSSEELEGLNILSSNHNRHGPNNHKLSQEQLDYIRKEHENASKYEESKSRHKKNAAISIKNHNFLETIQKFPDFPQNEEDQMIRYPKHDSGQQNHMEMQHTGIVENLSGTPMNHKDNQSRGIPSGGLPTDLRRENPLMGFVGSNKGSNGSGGAQNLHKLHFEGEKDMKLGKPSYRQVKQKNEDRNALSQD